MNEKEGQSPEMVRDGSQQMKTGPKKVFNLSWLPLVDELRNYDRKLAIASVYQLGSSAIP